jgi:hypothetical protein
VTTKTASATTATPEATIAPPTLLEGGPVDKTRSAEHGGGSVYACPTCRQVEEKQAEERRANTTSWAMRGR